MDDPPTQPCPPAPGDGDEVPPQRLLAESIYALSLARTRDEAFRVLLARATEVHPAAHWFLAEALERRGETRLVPVALGPGVEARLGEALQGADPPLFCAGLVRQMLVHHRAGLAAEAGKAPGQIPPPLATAGLRSLLAIPLLFEGRLCGALFAATFEGEARLHPGSEAGTALQGVARIGALVLERIQAEARLAETALLFRDLSRAVRDLAESADEDLLVAQLFQWASRLAPFPEWWFNRYDPATRTSRTTHWTPGVEAFGTVEAIRQPDAVEGDTLLETLHLRQRPVYIRRWEDLPARSGRAGWPGPMRSWVGLPLADEGMVLGSLSGGSFGSQGPVSLSEERFEALQSLAETAGLVLNRLQTLRALEAEETRFRLLFEKSPDPIALLCHGVIQDVNGASLDLLGHPRRALLGLGPLQLSPLLQPSGLTSREAARRFLEEVKAGARNRFEWTFLHASGREIPCEVAITQYRLGSDRIYHAVLRDLTAQKQGEAERVALERQLFQAQKLESLGVLAGGIAHDFNNLLMGVLGHAGLGLDQLGPEHPARRNLEAIQKAGQRAADLTRQMLAYSGRGQFEVRHLDLSAQVEEMLHLLEVSLPKTVTLQLDLGAGLPPVAADASQIQQVIMNLVINAAEAIGEVPGTITLSTGLRRLEGGDLQLPGQEVAPGDYVGLEVTDTGCGMDAATLVRIFEPFFTTKFTGRGLGLSAILGIVRGHQGAVRVYSELGRGTTFKVLLPAQAPAEALPTILAPVDEGPGSGLVLVVDDEATVRAVARQALEGRGFEVAEAADGLEALALLEARGEAVALVLLDMTMPRMGGEEAYREMRRLRPGLRVLLSSGYSEAEAMERFLGRGLKGFLQKPYGPRELVAKVQAALRT